MTVSDWTRTKRVLLVEDSPSLILQITTLLKEGQQDRFLVKHVGDLATALEVAAAEAFDVIIVDLGLPDSLGLNTFVEIHNAAPHVATIVFTSLDSEHLAIEALRLGAQDYIVKRDVDAGLLTRAINYAIERKKLVAELERSKEGLAQKTIQLIQTEKMTALGELTAGVAHELNQPLNAIKIICEDVLRDIANDRLCQDHLVESLKEAIEEIEKIAEIVDHMRVFSRRPTYLPRKVILSAAPIRRALKLIGQQLKDSKIEVLDEIDEDLLLHADGARLEQALLNILVNARDAVISNRNKKAMQISIRNYLEEKGPKNEAYLVYEIGDNGNGIPESLKEKIFEPFFTRKEPGKGTGLGLSAAMQIVKEHGGKIEVESTEGAGSIFRVFLPRGSRQQVT